LENLQLKLGRGYGLRATGFDGDFSSETPLMFLT